MEDNDQYRLAFISKHGFHKTARSAWEISTTKYLVIFLNVLKIL